MINIFEHYTKKKWMAYNMKYHVLLATKDRIEPFPVDLYEEARKRTEDFIIQADGSLIYMELQDLYVHAYVSMPPQYTPHRMAADIKRIMNVLYLQNQREIDNIFRSGYLLSTDAILDKKVKDDFLIFSKEKNTRKSAKPM